MVPPYRNFQHGAVYILENPESQRVKVGMTINNIVDRLSAINDMWLERTITCQVCGVRILKTGKYVSPHDKQKGSVHQYDPIGEGCPGGNELPIERDVALAEAHLEDLKNRHDELSGAEKGSNTKRIKTLEKRIEKYRHYTGPVGEWQFKIAFYTECVERVEKLSHEILHEYLDEQAPFGEVFYCTMSVAIEAVEAALSELGLLHTARKETQLREKRLLYKEDYRYQAPERVPARYECGMCRTQWKGKTFGINFCPKCNNHLYSKFLAFF